MGRRDAGRSGARQVGAGSPGEEIDQAADLAGLMRALDLGPAVVGGHSMGAFIASELGARFPEMVRAIILEDAPWWVPQPGAEPRGRMGRQSPNAKWIFAMEGMTVDEVVAQERPKHPTWPDEALRAWCGAKLELDPAFFDLGGQGRMDGARSPRRYVPGPADYGRSGGGRDRHAGGG